LLSIGVLVVLFAFGLLIYANIIEFNKELPHLLQRARDISEEVRDYIRVHLPRVNELIAGTSSVEEQGVTRLKEAAGSVANITAGVLLEALEIAFYLIFLLFEAGHFSERIRRGFASERADRILAVVGGINQAMANYLSVKVKASLVLA